MKNLTIRQARKSLGALDCLPAEEGEVMITRRGVAVARAVPVRNPRPMPSHAALRGSMPRMRKGSERLLREDREAR